jgi:hypothetical protein
MFGLEFIATLGQDAGLGECGWGTAASGATERTVVGRGIGHIDDESVQSHSPHAAVECAGRSWLTLQTDDLIGQEPQWGDAGIVPGTPWDSSGDTIPNSDTELRKIKYGAPQRR